MMVVLTLVESACGVVVAFVEFVVSMVAFW